MAISKEDIKHLEELARVKFNEKQEEERLAKDLGGILGYVDQLKEADVSGVEEMTHSVSLKNIFRKDSNKQSELVAELINAFPEKENNYLKVKAIL